MEIWHVPSCAPTAAAGHDAGAALSPLRILLAEDSPDNCTITIAYQTSSVRSWQMGTRKLTTWSLAIFRSIIGWCRINWKPD